MRYQLRHSTTNAHAAVFVQVRAGIRFNAGQLAIKVTNGKQVSQTIGLKNQNLSNLSRLWSLRLDRRFT